MLDSTSELVVQDTRWPEGETPSLADSADEWFPDTTTDRSLEDLFDLFDGGTDVSEDSAADTGPDSPEVLVFECETNVDCDDGVLCTQDMCLADLTCFHAPVVPCCGNLAIEEGEQCDDGNLVAGDGCDQECKLESPCPEGFPYVEGYCWGIGDSFTPGVHWCVEHGMVTPSIGGPNGDGVADVQWNQELFDKLVAALGYSSFDDPFYCCDGSNRKYLMCSFETMMCHTCMWASFYSPGSGQGPPTGGPLMCETAFHAVFPCLPLLEQQ